jgi:hypothetical protein
MKASGTILFAGICIALTSTTASSKQVPPPPKYDETVLKNEFYEFIDAMDFLTVTRDYPKAIRKLLSADPNKQIEAVKTLAETGEPEVIPWLLPFLEADNKGLRIWTGASLQKLVSSCVLKRRDKTIGEVVLIRPLRPGEKDLRPLAWVVLTMFRRPDDGNTHAYAASMARYLGLYEFERELKHCLKSKHPAVSNKAKWALESLEGQKEYEKRTSDISDGGDDK